MRLCLGDLSEQTATPLRTIRHYFAIGLLHYGGGGEEPIHAGHLRVLLALHRLRREGVRQLEDRRARIEAMTQEELAEFSGIPLESTSDREVEAPAAVAAPQRGAPPPDAEHFRRLEAMYLAAPINAIYQPRIVVNDGHAEITADARAELHHAAGGLHGSVLFKMLDDAAFFAVASTVTDVFVLTASFHISFLRPVVRGPMRAVGRVVRGSATISVAEAFVYGPDGREVARGAGDFVRSRVALSDLAYGSAPPERAAVGPGPGELRTSPG